MPTLTREQTNQFNDIFEEFGRTLDITEEQYQAAVKSYQYVGQWLASDDSPLAPFHPEILPQGSFLFGTMTRPDGEDDDLDIDLVCRFDGKLPQWTQFDLKRIVGERLKSNGVIARLVQFPDGRRCWTLKYADSSHFHMDVLPAIVSSGYKTILEKSLRAEAGYDFGQLAIRITDKKENNYKTATRPEEWLKSNPFGYGIWFEQQATVRFEKAVRFSEAVQPVPVYRKDKLPLQRVVQILKRHRDLMFNGDEHKPISIIITTLAARAYRKETNITEALINVVKQMPSEIEEVYSTEKRKMVKRIINPVNPEENFADKWPDKPVKEKNFYDWIAKVTADIYTAMQQRGLQKIQESLEKPLGKNTVIKAFSSYGETLRKSRESGALRMAGGAGVLGEVGTVVRGHTFHGN